MVLAKKRKIIIESDNDDEPVANNSNDNKDSYQSEDDPDFEAEIDTEVESEEASSESEHNYELDSGDEQPDSSLHIIPDFINRQYAQKLDKVTIFNNACKQFGYSKRPIKKVKEWFDVYKLHRHLNRNISEHYMELIKLIHNTFNPSVPDLIKAQMSKTKYNKVLTFQRVCKRIDFQPADDSQVQLWFQRYQTNDEALKEDIGEDYFGLVQKISAEYVQNKNLLFKFNESRLSQGRYAFDVSSLHSNGFLGIKDYYNGSITQLKINNILLKVYINSIEFRFITNSYLLMIEKAPTHLSSFCIVQLVKFNLEKGVSKIVDKEFGVFDQYAIVPDSNDMNKFLLMSTRYLNSTFFALTIDLNVGKFTSTRNIRVNDSDNLYCPRLIGNELSGLKLYSMGFGAQFQEISYWQMDFNRNKKNKEIKEDEWEDDEREEAEAKIMFKFGVDAFIDLNTGYFSNSYAWVDNVCFMHGRNHTYTYNLYAVYLEFQKCALINLDNGLRLNEMHLRDDGCLVGNNHNDAYCFTLNKPEKLEYTTWFSIKKRSNKNEKLYDYAKKVLPFNSQFQPFYISH